MRGTEEIWDAQEKFGMHREVWNVCEKPWDAQGGLGCIESYGMCVRNLGMHRRNLGCIERCGVHGEHTGSGSGQGHLAHHVPTVPRVCPGGLWHRGVTAVGSPGRAALGPAQRQLPGIQ